MLQFVEGGRVLRGAVKEERGSLLHIHEENTYINIYIKRPIYIYPHVGRLYIYLSCVKKTFMLPFVGGVMPYVGLCKRNTSLFYIYIKRPIYMYQYIHKETYIYIYQHIGRLHLFVMCKKDLYIAICRGCHALRRAVKEEYVTFLYIHKETYIYVSIYT